MKKHRILMIDDDQNDIDLLRAHLNLDVYDFFFALTTESGEKKAIELHPDVIILDNRFGSDLLSGNEICLKLRELFETKEIPIIIYTNNIMEKGLFVTNMRSKADYVEDKRYPYRTLAVINRIIEKKEELSRAIDLERIFQIEKDGHYLKYDQGSQRIYIDGIEKAIRPQCIKLLQRLVINFGHPTPTEELIEALFSEDEFGRNENDVYRLINNLREIIEPEKSTPIFLRSRKGLGYFVDGKIMADSQ